MTSLKHANTFLRLLFMLIFGTCGLVAYPQPGLAGDSKWAYINVPAEGVGGQWVLAAGSNLRHLVQAADGTLYCRADPDGTPYRLFKSVDGGARWSYTGRVTGDIAAIAALPGNPDIIYYATFSSVYKSGDAGKTFNLLVSNPGGAGIGSIEISSLDAAATSGNIYLVIGTRDAAGKQGGAYLLQETQPLMCTTVLPGNRDVLKAVFSPRFEDDGRFTLVTTDHVDTIVVLGRLENDGSPRLTEASLAGIVPVSAGLAYADREVSNHAARFIQFLALNTGSGGGGVYRLESRAGVNPAVVRLDNGLISDADCLAACAGGDKIRILAGAIDRPGLFYSDDAGESWRSAPKPPSGDYITGLALASDFPRSGLAYAVSGGAESAFSISRDCGMTWNQTGLVDTRVSAILDLAVPAADGQAATLYLLTADCRHSLWRSVNQGIRWERVLCSSTLISERINLVLPSPNYRQNGRVLVAGTRDDFPVIWQSHDRGQTFNRYDSSDPQTAGPVNIDCWALSNEDVLFVGSFDGTDSFIYQTGADSLVYVDKGYCGPQVIHSLAVSPDYTSDGTLVAGNIYGQVFISTDNGLVFETLPYHAPQPPLNGNITVALAAGYAHNRTLYAADDTPGGGLYRFVPGESHSWKPLGSGWPEKSRIGQLAVSRQGVLYALDLQAVDSLRGKGGIQRCLDPALSSPRFETFLAGLDEGTSLKILRIEQDRLWTVDCTHNRILTWQDSLAPPVVPALPFAGAAGLDASRVDLRWNPVSGASTYLWQVDTDAGFLNLAKNWQGQTDAQQVRLTGLDTDTTYYWRVRVNQPLSGPWSEIRTFSTVKTRIPVLSQPASGSNSALQPLFRWNSQPAADQYEIRVARDDRFNQLVMARFCPVNTWQCDLTLEYKTGYYWKVRAWYGTNAGEWSAVGYFTTLVEQQPAVLPRTKINAPRPASPLSANAAEIEPVFRWSSVEGAVHYELWVAQNDYFSPVVIERICPASAWKSEISLGYATTYYWKVRAVSAEGWSDWSDVHVFTTRNQPAAPVSPTGSSARAESTPVLTSTASPGVAPAAALLPSATPVAASSPVASQPVEPSKTPVTAQKTVTGPAAQPAPPGTLAAKVESPASPELTRNALTPVPGHAGNPTADLKRGAQSDPATGHAGNPVNTWLVWLVGGLTVVTVITSAVMIFLLKKLRAGAK